MSHVYQTILNNVSKVMVETYAIPVFNTKMIGILETLFLNVKNVLIKKQIL